MEQDRKLSLLEKCSAKKKGSFLVFARTKHEEADKLAKKLSLTGAKTATIHGNRTQNQRNQALSGFQDGYYRVLVATDNRRGPRHPYGGHRSRGELRSAAGYARRLHPHRAGRTGRAGATGTATTFATRAERPDISRIERLLATRLVRREVPSDVGREQKSAGGVIVIPFTPPPAQSAMRDGFAPKGRGSVRRAV